MVILLNTVQMILIDCDLIATAKSIAKVSCQLSEKKKSADVEVRNYRR